MNRLNSTTQNYGRKLRKLRMARNISQFDLEIMADLSMGSISRMENSRINPTKETLFKIATVLNLSPAETVDLFCINEYFGSQTNVYIPSGLRLHR